MVELMKFREHSKEKCKFSRHLSYL